MINLQKQQKGKVMGKYSKKSSVKSKGLKRTCVVLAIVLLLLITVLMALILVQRFGERRAAENNMPMKELVIQSTTEQEDTVIVSTTYGTLRYPFAFSDIMVVEAKTFEDYAMLEFRAVIDDAEFMLYALYFNGKEGIPVGTLQVDGNIYVITSQLYTEENISDDDMVTFYAAQETCNDVLSSLAENQGFTAAK